MSRVRPTTSAKRVLRGDALEVHTKKEPTQAKPGCWDGVLGQEVNDE